MKYWSTNIIAIDPLDVVLKNWTGPAVPGINKEDAEQYCQVNGLGYLHVIGERVGYIPTKADEQTPDWNRAQHYDNLN